MKEANFSVNSDNGSSFDETGRAMNKTPAILAAITPAKFDNSFWVLVLIIRIN
jgi:hypothetical protein